ncbi:MAG TPA: FkbM family methyltransferase [Vicinamibacterales bacterium]|nr:FkbM family methyltransferase [Vicinamibacterales bacterium]
MISGIATSIADRMGRTSGTVRALQPAYDWWLRTTYGRKGMPWHVNGEPLRIDPSVRRFMPHENEPALTEYLRTHMRPGDTVVDVGAFLGTYAILAARWVGPTGRVLALEPSPGSYDVLTRHLAYNGVADRVEARCAAAGAVPDRRELAVWSDEPYRNMIATAATVEARVPVDVVTIDDLCHGWTRPPDWIRMDVQGLELDVLAGAKNVIRAARDRITVVVEVHPEQWPDYGIRPADVLDVFFALGLEAAPLPARAALFEQGAHVVLKAKGR